ncbi:MAG: NAD+ synthase, partial [Phycisphaerales bacterium JB039]
GKLGQDDEVGAAALITGAIARATSAGADLVVLPELAICGYPPRDLLLAEGFIEACIAAARRIGETATDGITAIFGCPLPVDGAGVANSLLAYRDGNMLGYHDKRLLPTYDVFDEDRYFTAGSSAVVIDVGGVPVGLAICEDLWKGHDAGFAEQHLRSADPVAEVVRAGARLIVAPSASPFVLGKGMRHDTIVREHCLRHGVWIASVNQLGGNDELIFDGRATLRRPDGSLAAASCGFSDDLLIADFDPGDDSGPEAPDPCAQARPEWSLFQALTLGVRDYLRKTGFRKAVIGLSGGIDSAVTCAIAAAAIGAENVLGVAMPGPFSSEGALTDARDLAERLGVRFVTLPIGASVDALRSEIDPVFAELGERKLGAAQPDIAYENLQSRARGAALMTISNRTGAIVLTTGNKSELAVGYCTLYGDMNGGLAVLSDVPKTRVYDLARWINARHAEAGFARPPIPESTITKPPSAELAPDQKDEDSLPPYDILDTIIERHVELRQSARRIIADTGVDPATVQRVIRLIAINEYKRKQLATGLKVTTLAFGSGRRMPIAQGWREENPEI